MILRVKNWSQFQHYKHRKPPWIKLHRGLLDDITWHNLPLDSRALAPMLWLIASETQEGKIEGELDALAFRLHIASKALAKALKPLISAGWIIESDPASILLAPCLQHATSESEYRVQSLTTNSTDPPRDASLTPRGYATRGSAHERVAALAPKHRSKI
jgi:hypothetical protein